MFELQFSSHPAHTEHNEDEVPKDNLKRSWYSQTFSGDDDEEERGAHAGSVACDGALFATCGRASANADDCSEASTDAGTDEGREHDNMEDSDAEEVQTAVHWHRRTQAAAIPTRPRLPKVSRQQRIDQLNNIVDEFCALDFDAVDASCQEGVARRMLVVLRSLEELVTFNGHGGRSEESRFSLLGVAPHDQQAINVIACRAQQLCDARRFREAFRILREAGPRIRGRSQRNPEDADAMAARRLLKRQRQRQERREQRASERRERAALKAAPVKHD